MQRSTVVNVQHVQIDVFAVEKGLQDLYFVVLGLVAGEVGELGWVQLLTLDLDETVKNWGTVEFVQRVYRYPVLDQ